MPDSSRFATRDNVILRVMSGKGGKIAARNGKDVATDGTVGGKNGNDARRWGRLHAASPRCQSTLPANGYIG
jgi:hypothetical protein